MENLKARFCYFGNKVRWLAILFAIIGTFYNPAAQSNLMSIRTLGILVIIYNFIAEKIPWAKFSNEKIEWLARLFISMDILGISLYLYFTGGIHSNYFAYYLLDILFASAIASTGTQAFFIIFIIMSYLGIILMEPSFQLQNIFFVVPRLGSVIIVAWFSRKLMGTLHLEKERIKSVIEDLSDGVIVLDRLNRIVFLNHTAESLLGIEGSQIMGCQIAPGDTFGINWKDLSQVIGFSLTSVKDAPGSESKRLEATFTRTNKVVEFVSFPINSSLANKWSRVFVMHDITLQKEIERIRTDTFFMITHDLKTPLTAIKLGSNLLEKQICSDPWIKEVTQTINHEISRMQRLIANIMDAALSECGKLKIHKKSLNLSEVIEDVSAAFRLDVQDNMLNFESDIQRNLPEVTGDRDKIERILWNLLNNALKFTPSGGAIRLSAKEISPDRLSSKMISSSGVKSYIVIGVSDTGSGISIEKQAHIFERFYKAEDSDSIVIKRSGYGLGLAICKELIEMHGGNVWLESEPEKGATFFLCLPVTLEKAEEEPEDSSFSSNSAVLAPTPL